MTDQMANTSGHVQWPSIILTPTINNIRVMQSALAGNNLES